MREMSARSGVNEATLRMWEVRHGFPQPRRVSSGHRRYSESDVARVRAVVRAPGARAVASGGDRARPRCGGRAAALGVCVVALALPCARGAAPVQASDAVDVPRDRGRVPGARRAPAAVRLLPARALLPQRPRAGGASSRGRPSGRSCWPISRAPARPETGPDRGPDRGDRSRRPGVGDRVRVAELRRVPGRVGATPGAKGIRRALVRGGVDGGGAGGPPRGAGVPAARLGQPRPNSSTTSASGSTRRRSPASTSCARRSSSAPGWWGTRPRVIAARSRPARARPRSNPTALAVAWLVGARGPNR